MFNSKRIKVLVTITSLLMLVPVCRFAQLQLLSSPSYLEEIDRLQQGYSRQTQTIRGRILDRNGKVLATEEPLFKLYVTYDKITRFADARVQRAMQVSALSMTDPDKALAEVNEEIENGLQQLDYLLTLCNEIGLSSADIHRKITRENNRIWNLRMFQAWRNNCTSSPLYQENKDNPGRTFGDLARADFAEHFPDRDQQVLKVSEYGILEMHSFFPLAELKNDEDQFLALTALEGMEGVEVTAQASRTYPYKTVAAHLIGWVGPATQKEDLKVFEHDRLAKYQDGELCGRESGIERVCEPILRGRRGELVYDIDRNPVDKEEKRFGRDVYLTLDVELQQAVEDDLATREYRPCCGPGKAAVIIDVQSNEILVMASLPLFDLNTARYRYNELRDAPGKPLTNRAMNKNYPPGSVAKPLVAVAGLESGTITPREAIACPSTPPPTGWPRCWTQKQHGYGHDDLWPGQNNARNAIKGSCNIYFSHLAERIEVSQLQTWFSRFGYGRRIPLTRPLQFVKEEGYDLRTLHQGSGRIIAGSGSKRLAGIGQGNMRVTPLQVANSMATLARRGQFKNPTLFQMNTSHSATSHAPEDLRISETVMNVVLDGMDAVVNERHGSAYSAFQEADFDQHGVRVYGKTGSTEDPENAWFAGFTRDGSGRVLAMAVVVEGGQSGGIDAAPVARGIFGLCVKAGYLGSSAE